LATSSYVQADDTGARHQGRNGYCTYLGNERFAWFASTDSKSRINFLELLQAERRYAVNAEALAYMAERGLAADHRELLAARPVDLGAPSDWAAHLRRLGVESPRAVTLATEGALIGGLAAQGFNLDMGLVSDDAYDKIGKQYDSDDVKEIVGLLTRQSAAPALEAPAVEADELDAALAVKKVVAKAKEPAKPAVDVSDLEDIMPAKKPEAEAPKAKPAAKAKKVEAEDAQEKPAKSGNDLAALIGDLDDLLGSTDD
jgi:hypothetical protein